MNRMKQNMKNLFQSLSILLRIKPEIPFLIALITLLRAVLPFVNIIFSQLIIDEFLGFVDYKRLTIFAILAVFINAVILFTISILSKVNTTLDAKLGLYFNKKLNFHQMNLAYADIESNKVKELNRDIDQTRMRTGGLETIINDFEVVIRNILNLILAFFTFIHIFSIQNSVVQESFWTKPWPLFILLFLTLGSIILSFGLQAKQNDKISDINIQANQANGGAMLYMQLISDYHFGKDIRIYDLKSYLCKEFDKLWKSSIGYKLSKKLGREKSKIPCFTSICNSILDLIIYLLAIMKAITGEISAGTVVLYVGSIQIFTQSIMGLVNSIGEMLVHAKLFAPYFTLLNMPEETSTESFKELPTAPYSIAFHNVSFRYPDSDKMALTNVNFVIQPGQRVALVGVNGSGKTTVIKLLCRLYEPQKGEITLNGINIKEFNLAQYRALLSVVFQDFSLLSLNLGENIGCTDQFLQDRVLEAISNVGLSGWLSKQPDKLGTYLYKDYAGNGVEVSGGEAQKIAIARAIYKNSPLVILDEPTAALDPRAEAEIYENFNKIISDKTAIYISHRLSSCRFCDNILVFDSGKLIQSGTHEELVNNVGQYQQMWSTQAQFYTT